MQTVARLQQPLSALPARPSPQQPHMLQPQQHHQQPPHHHYGQGGPYQGTHAQQPPAQTHQAGQGSTKRGRPSGGVHINQVCCLSTCIEPGLNMQGHELLHVLCCLFSEMSAVMPATICQDIYPLAMDVVCLAEMPGPAAVQRQHGLHDNLYNFTCTVFAARDRHVLP